MTVFVVNFKPIKFEPEFVIGAKSVTSRHTRGRSRLIEIKNHKINMNFVFLNN